MRPPSRRVDAEGREDQGLNAACSIPKRAGKRERTCRGVSGRTSEAGNRREVGDPGEERALRLCKAPTVRSLLWFLSIPSLGGGRESRELKLRLPNAE